MAKKVFLALAGPALLAAVWLLGCGEGVRTPLGDIVWTQFQQQKEQTQEAAAARYNYCPSGGCVIRLESVSLKPTLPRPGETVALATSYTILTAEQIPIPVTISREIFFQGKSLGKIKDTSTTNLNGTWSQQIDFPLPADARPGVYTLVTRIHTGYGFDEKKVDFTVQ